MLYAWLSIFSSYDDTTIKLSGTIRYILNEIFKLISIQRAALFGSFVPFLFVPCLLNNRKKPITTLHIHILFCDHHNQEHYKTPPQQRLVWCTRPVTMQEIELSEESAQNGRERESESPAKLTMPRVLRPEYDDFFRTFLRANRPCVVAAATASWPCAQLWVHNERIDYNYLSLQYGDLTAPLTDCRQLDNPKDPEQRTVRDYMLYLSGADGTRPSTCQYLKDWHLRRVRPDDPFYVVPQVFASDWLNEYCLDKDMDDFMFVYIGPKGSWTPLHADVYSSFSWSVNVVGRKRWLLLPPGEETKLLDKFGKLPLQFAPSPELRCLQVVQEAGDAIFIPSGWHHIVYNELDTISINHNWINGCNVARTWKAMRRALVLVEKEIDHLKEDDTFAEDCQKMLKSDHGMNYGEFVDFVLHIGEKRLRQRQGEPATLHGGYKLGSRHVMFDMSAVSEVATEMIADEHASEIIGQNGMLRLSELKEKIDHEMS